MAGTPPEQFPRRADAEMRGEQVILRDFFIDKYPYPNEEGAIPKTNVTQPQAAAICADAGKRLCTELEWERACKGTRNTTYPYGNKYRAEICKTGSASRMLPAGLNYGCRQ